MLLKYRRISVIQNRMDKFSFFAMLVSVGTRFCKKKKQILDSFHDKVFYGIKRIRRIRYSVLNHENNMINAKRY